MGIDVREKDGATAEGGRKAKHIRSTEDTIRAR